MAVQWPLRVGRTQGLGIRPPADTPPGSPTPSGGPGGLLPWPLVPDLAGPWVRTSVRIHQSPVSVREDSGCVHVPPPSQEGQPS